MRSAERHETDSLVGVAYDANIKSIRRSTSRHGSFVEREHLFAVAWCWAPITVGALDLTSPPTTRGNALADVGKLQRGRIEFGR
jgi:hypothetical protein